MTTLSFQAAVNAQVTLLNDGKPLEAFDEFFAPDGLMYANDEIFATGAEEGHRKQEPYMLAANSINGLIEGLIIAEPEKICAFRNRTSFVSSDGATHQIDGLCWQKWCDGKIVEERYYDGEKMQSVIEKGILSNPERFLTDAEK